jgi:hypothetical protein
MALIPIVFLLLAVDGGAASAPAETPSSMSVETPASVPLDTPSDAAVAMPTNPPVSTQVQPPPAKSLFPEYGLETFDLSQTPWGPGRRTSGEGFRSMATTLPEGPMRLNGKWWSLGFGAQLFARGEVRDNADFRSHRSDLAPQVDHRARLTLRASAFNRIGILIEFQDVRLWGSERTTATAEPFAGLHQGFVDLRATDWLAIRIGRQELCYGEDRLLGCLDWAQSARAFDGAFARASLGMLTLDAFGFYVKSHAVLTRTFADGSAQELTNTGSYLYGLYARIRPNKTLGVDTYALGFTEDPTSVVVGQRPSNHTVTLGARATGSISTLTLTGEGAFQTGRSNSQLIVAGAFAGRAVYRAPLFGDPYALFEVLGATGDGNAADGVQRQFNQLFPTGHIHLGYIDYVGWSNVIDVHGAVGWKPLGMHVWVDYHQFRFWDTRGRWLNAGGAVFVEADPLRTGSLMGDEVDLSFTVPITPNVSVATSFSWFIPGAGAATARGSTVGRGRGMSTWGFLYIRSQL